MSDEPNKSKIERSVRVPERVSHQIKHLVERIRGGYVVIESRSPWDESEREWSRLEVAKLIEHKPTGRWIVYWKRASGRWEQYGSYKALSGAIRALKTDRYGCFWG